MKLATSTYVKIGLILLLCVLICGWLGGCGRYSYWADRGITLFPAGGILGCAATEMAADTIEEIVDGGLSDVSELPDLPSLPSAPSAPSAPSVPTAPPAPSTSSWGMGSFSLEAPSSMRLEMNWIAGEVDIRVVPDSETGGMIVATETINGRAPELEWKLSGDTLFVNYARDTLGLSGCSNGWHGNKKLELLLPESMMLSAFNLSAASGRYNIEGRGGAGTPTGAVSLEVASGNVSLKNFDATNLSIELASGNVDFEGMVSDIAIDQASGRTTIRSAAYDAVGVPHAITARLASGSLGFELGPTAVLKETISKTSGNYTNNLPPVEEGDSPTECIFDLDMLSGDCTVKSISL